MGVGTIIEARRCLLLATGNSKAEVIAQAVEGPITSMVIRFNPVGLPAGALVALRTPEVMAATRHDRIRRHRRPAMHCRKASSPSARRMRRTDRAPKARASHADAADTRADAR